MKPNTLSRGILGYLEGRQLEFHIFHIFWWVILLLASSPGFSWFLLLLASPPLCNAMQWKSFHLDAAAVNQSEPTIGRESTSGTRPFWKAAQIVTIEEKMCENAFGSFVSAVIPVGAQLSICGIQSIITSFSRTKWKNKILPDLNECRKVSYNLWTNWTVWGQDLQFSIRLHQPLSPPRPKSGANEMQNWDGPHSSWAEIKSKPVLNRQRFCSLSAFIRSNDELAILQRCVILIFCLLNLSPGSTTWFMGNSIPIADLLMDCDDKCHDESFVWSKLQRFLLCRLQFSPLNQPLMWFATL